MYRSSVKVFLAGTNSQMSLVGLIGRLCANHSKYLTTRLLSQSSSVSGDDGSFFALNEDQLCQYNKDGYLVIKDIFHGKEMEELVQAVDELIDMSRKKSESDKYFMLVKGHTSERSLLKRSRVICPSLVHPVWHKALRQPKLLDIVSQLVGSPSIRYIMQEKIHMKNPGEDGSKGIKWHQDWAFLPHTNDSIVTVGLAIDDSTEENGCLQVVPGTHNGPILSHFDNNKFVSAITDPAFDSSSAVCVEVPAGGASFHHVRIAHASGPNTSNRSRRVCFIQYCATDAWPLIGVVGPEGYGVEGRVDWDRFCSTIVRGSPNLFPRMVNIPVSLPFPYDRVYDVFHEENSKAM